MHFIKTKSQVHRMWMKSFLPNSIFCRDVLFLYILVLFYVKDAHRFLLPTDVKNELYILGVGHYVCVMILDEVQMFYMF